MLTLIINNHYYLIIWALYTITIKDSSVWYFWQSVTLIIVSQWLTSERTAEKTIEVYTTLPNLKCSS
jgi:hypothetical protein